VWWHVTCWNVSKGLLCFIGLLYTELLLEQLQVVRPFRVPLSDNA